MKVPYLRYYPIIYVVPFLLSTVQLELVASFSELSRWLVMFFGLLILFDFRLKPSPRKLASPVATDWLLILLSFWFFASAAWSISSFYTFQRAASIALLFLVSFWVFWRFADLYSEEYLLRSMLGVVAVVLFFNLIAAPFLPSRETGGRFSGVFVNPNNIGMIAGLCIPLSFSFWLRSRSKLDLFYFSIPMAALILAGTRSALVGILVATSAIIIASSGRKPVWSIFTFLLIALGIGGFSQTDFFLERILREDSISTASNRVFFWDLAKRYIANRPILGHGFGTDVNIHEYYGLNLTQLGLRGYGVMSSYYGLAVQMGWTFTVAFFTWLWLLAIRCTIFRLGSIETVTLGATIISGLLICIFEPAIYSAGNAFSFLFWIVVMLAVRRLAYRRYGIPLNANGGLVTVTPVMVRHAGVSRVESIELLK